MILILLGTQDNSFHRLLDKVQELIDKKVITEKVIVQAGRTKYESKDMEIYSLMPEEKLREIMKKADLVITHGGVGSIVMALKMGKKVIAVPRLSAFGEHINDHQIQIVDSFDKQDFLIGVTELDDLEEKAQSKKGKFTKKMGGETEAQRACGKLRRLRNVLKEIVSADKTGSIRRRFNQVIDCLIENGFVNGVVEPETIPEVLEDNLKKKKSISKFKIEPPKHDNSGKTGEDKSTQRESDAEPVEVVPEEDVEVLDNDDYLL